MNTSEPVRRRATQLTLVVLATLFLSMGLASAASAPPKVSEAEAAAAATQSGLAPSGGTGSAPIPGSGDVLVVGDSLEVLTSPYLQRYLPGIHLTVNAQGGYNSFQIFDLFKQSYDPSQSVIVFDAGTNDNPSYPQILAGNLDQVAAMIGDRCMVVPTIHGLIVNGVNNDGKNRVVRSFAASRPGTQVPDWAGFVAAHPELMQSDNLHPNAAGADRRAKLIASAVKACLFTPPVSAAPRAPKPSRVVSQPPKPVAGGHLAAAEVMRRIAVTVGPEVGLVRTLFAG